jgi:hypothetical protein
VTQKSGRNYSIADYSFPLRDFLSLSLSGCRTVAGALACVNDKWDVKEPEKRSQAG